MPLGVAHGISQAGHIGGNRDRGKNARPREASETMTQDIRSLHDRLWNHVPGTKDFELLPVSPFDRTLAILDAIPAQGFGLEQFNTDLNTYVRIILQEDSRAAREAVAEVCQMVGVVTPWYQETTLFLDSIPDDQGRYRVYVWDMEYWPGTPIGGFLFLDDALAWLCDRLDEPSTACNWPTVDDDTWEQSPTSGACILVRMLDPLLSDLWTEVPDWSPSGDTPDHHSEDRSPGWERRMCLHAFDSLICTGTVPIATMATSELGPVHQRFVDHLKEFEGAVHGRRPTSLTSVAGGGHPLSEASRQWLERFGQ